MLKVIHAGEDLAAARQQAVRVIEKLRGLRLTTAAELVESAVEETLAHYAFPEQHWRRIRTNNEVARRPRQSAWHPRSFQGLTIRSGWRAQESELVADWSLIVPPPAPARYLLEAKSTA
jgi:hypothetical protein